MNNAVGRWAAAAGPPVSGPLTITIQDVTRILQTAGHCWEQPPLAALASIIAATTMGLSERIADKGVILTFAAACISICRLIRLSRGNVIKRRRPRRDTAPGGSNEQRTESS